MGAKLSLLHPSNDKYSADQWLWDSGSHMIEAQSYLFQAWVLEYKISRQRTNNDVWVSAPLQAGGIRVLWVDLPLRYNEKMRPCAFSGI
jgi:hypothetical protein